MRSSLRGTDSQSEMKMIFLGARLPSYCHYVEPASPLVPQQIRDAPLPKCFMSSRSFLRSYCVCCLEQVSCREEEVHERAEGAAAERAESGGGPEHHQPHHGGQVFPN